jgi:hypothetical protein
VDDLTRQALNLGRQASNSVDQPSSITNNSVQRPSVTNSVQRPSINRVKGSSQKGKSNRNSKVEQHKSKGDKEEIQGESHPGSKQQTKSGAMGESNGKGADDLKETDRNDPSTINADSGNNANSGNNAASGNNPEPGTRAHRTAKSIVTPQGGNLGITTSGAQGGGNATGNAASNATGNTTGPASSVERKFTHVGPRASYNKSLNNVKQIQSPQQKGMQSLEMARSPEELHRELHGLVEGYVSQYERETYGYERNPKLDTLSV